MAFKDTNKQEFHASNMKSNKVSFKARATLSLNAYWMTKIVEHYYSQEQLYW